MGGGPDQPTAPPFGDPATGIANKGIANTANKGTANKGTANKGTANKGIANKGTANKGTPNKGTANKGTANKGADNRGAGRPDASLAAPAVVAFPDLAVGEHVTADVYVYNLDPLYEASLLVTVIGSPAFVVRTAPVRLRPSREGPSSPIVLAFVPSDGASANARLRVAATWQMNAVAPTELFVELRGEAHTAGAMTNAETVTQQRAEAARLAAVAREARTAARLEAAFAKESADPRAYPHQGQVTALRRLYDSAERELDKIGDDQRVGITTVDGEARTFRRRVVQAESSLALALAFAALDAASAGLAAGLTSAIGDRFRAMTAAPRRGAPHPRMIDTFQEGFKVLFEVSAADAAKAQLQAAAGRAGTPPADQPEAILYFFRQQQLTLNKLKAARRQALERAYYGLMPGLRTDGTATLKAMEDAVTALTTVADKAVELQEHAERIAWMSYLAQSAMGARTSDELRRRGMRPMPAGGPVTDIRGIGETAPPGGQVTPIDGVLEVEIEADYRAPSRPVKVLNVRCSGVTRAMLEAVIVRHGPRLRGLPLVVRAAGHAPGIHEFAVNVVKDEAGNVGFTDNTAAAGQPSKWLARKAGKWDAAAQHEGARTLMEEVLDAPIDVEAMLWTDQA